MELCQAKRSRLNSILLRFQLEKQRTFQTKCWQEFDLLEQAEEPEKQVSISSTYNKLVGGLADLWGSSPKNFFVLLDCKLFEKLQVCY